MRLMVIVFLLVINNAYAGDCFFLGDEEVRRIRQPQGQQEEVCFYVPTSDQNPIMMNYGMEMVDDRAGFVVKHVTSDRRQTLQTLTLPAGKSLEVAQIQASKKQGFAYFTVSMKEMPLTRMFSMIYLIVDDNGVERPMLTVRYDAILPPLHQRPIYKKPSQASKGAK